MPIRPRSIWTALGLWAFFLQSASAQAPLSAIDWLSQSLAVPSGTNISGEPAISQDGALPENVSVSVLGKTSADSVGLLAPDVTGFPRSLWGLGQTSEIASAVAASRLDGLPALQGLLLTLLLAEADAPSDSAGGSTLLIARVDKLLEIGALEQARALLQASGAVVSADLFRRKFDVALLTGDETQACAELQAAPGMAPTLTARVFCLARSGDWNAAALTLRTSQVLGHITPEEDALLSRFLDPDLFEGDTMPPPPKPVTPLILRIYEAIGEPLPTSTLPLAFAYADLDDRSGWKAQIEAAERLTRAGAISSNVLLGLYTQRAPAASGGVWDRADAFQRFDAAIAKGDVETVGLRLPQAYDQMRAMELEVPFASLFAEPLGKLALSGNVAETAFEIGLLSSGYERFAATLPSGLANQRTAFLSGLARGSLSGLTAPDSMARAIAPAFDAPAISDEFQILLDQRRLGEAILLAMIRINGGLQGDLKEVTDGLALLRSVGLEDVARRTALQLMLLERRG